jgi:hypothetical protein
MLDGILKLCDFGSAKRTYLSYEEGRFKNLVQSGLILYKMLTDHSPFDFRREEANFPKGTRILMHNLLKTTSITIGNSLGDPWFKLQFQFRCGR